MLEDPKRWWRQVNLVEATSLDDGNVSRSCDASMTIFCSNAVSENCVHVTPLYCSMLGRRNTDSVFTMFSPLTSAGRVLSSRVLSPSRLKSLDVPHAFTGLPAAWALEGFASFRLVTVYVDADPREVADSLDIRVSPKGANIQLVGPNDSGVFAGAQEREGLCCVAPVQVYLDLLQLPERANEAAQHLRAHTLRWAVDAG